MPHLKETLYFWKCEECECESPRFAGNGDEYVWWDANHWKMDLTNDRMLCSECASK